MTRGIIGVLILSTATSVPMAAAQEPRHTGFADSIEREAVRLARADTGPDIHQATGDDAWSRVRQLRPGVDISVAVAGRGQAARTLLQADDSTLTLLNAAGAGLPSETASVLHRVATAHPQWFLRSGVGERIELDRTLALTADGLYAGRRKIADRSAIFEVVPRPEVETVSLLERKSNRGAGTIGGIIGGLVGFGVGYSMVAGSGREGQYGPLFYGPAIGAVAGAITVSRFTAGRTTVVVYRRP